MTSTQSRTCRLELMGVPDTVTYRRLARGILPQAKHLISGLNVPNKKPDEPLLEWCKVCLDELPDVDVCVHYSVKHHRREGEAGAVFAQFCKDAEATGVKRVLLCTGNGSTQVDALTVLERLQGRRPASKHFRIGVCFNAGIPEGSKREVECQRLRRKLETGLVDEVWLNTCSDAELQRQGIAFVQDTAKRSNIQELKIFGSTLLPNEAQRKQMLERPWASVHLSDIFLRSLTDMWRLMSEVVCVFREDGVEPLVESKVRTIDDVNQLQKLLYGKEMSAGSNPCRPMQSKLSDLESHSDLGEYFIPGLFVLVVFVFALLGLQKSCSFKKPVQGLQEPLLHGAAWMSISGVSSMQAGRKDAL